MRRRRRDDIAKYALTALGALGLAGLLRLISATADEGASFTAAVLLALIPLLVVLLTVWWIDRWEPEPPSVLLTAFLWGAGVATVVSLVVNTTASIAVANATGLSDSGEIVSTVVSAPIIEETTKGLGVLIIFLLRRSRFNGAVDGIVYAAVVAAGFAFAENILYFVRYSDEIVRTFIMRAIASPFAHVIFTACTGLAIGVGARMRSRSAWAWTTPIGLAGAIALHAFWNGVLASAPALYFVVVIPFSLACVALVVWLRWRERMTMRKRLADYARAGWLDPAEVDIITTGSGRSAARHWAKARGPQAVEAMRDLLKAASSLAALRQQALDGHAEADHAAQERELLETVRRSKRVLVGW
ncbi:hypothetical protein AM609_07175 [Actinomyces sp. oral taxon 414]|nr:hypothetical protein AM609_07175 [Actinomyces sp. oral taxon 414]